MHEDLSSTKTYTPPQDALEKIQSKTEELYDKRIAPYAKDIDPVHREAIMNFQKIVFTIDYYYEHNEKIDPAVVNDFWHKAEKYLEQLHVDKEVQHLLLEDVKDYAGIESSTRKGRKLMDYGIKLFYFKKSCDVRMQRHLLRYLIKEKPESSPEEISRDILEEIEDDIDDIEEDKETQNGNRFLEILNSGDQALMEEYKSFVATLGIEHSELSGRILEKIEKAQKN